MKSDKEKLQIFVTFSEKGDSFDTKLEKIFLDYIKNIEATNEEV